MSLRRTQDVSARFWAKVEKTPTCWLWTASMSTGYGQFYLRGRIVPAHRVSYKLQYGQPSPQLCVLHTCDNRICVRPDHLFIGTKSDNTWDSVWKGRHGRVKKTHCPEGHGYSIENTYLNSNGKGGLARHCRICKLIQQRTKCADVRRP